MKKKPTKRAPRKVKTKVTTWTKSDGEIVVIADMTSTHILNTIGMLVRKAKAADRYAELAGFDSIRSITDSEVYQALVDEAYKRLCRGEFTGFRGTSTSSFPSLPSNLDDPFNAYSY